MKEQVAKILGNMAYEVEMCGHKDPALGLLIKQATLQICQLSQERVERTVKDDAGRCAGYLKLAREECRERVDGIFKEIEKYLTEVLGHNPEELRVWQVLKKKELG